MSLPTIRAAADYFGVPFEGVFGSCRERPFVLARFAVAYVMREREGQSYPQIGRRLKRDHSSILHGHRQARDLMRRDPDFAAFVNAQLDLPRYSPVAAILESPFTPWEAAPVPPPKVAVWKPPVTVPKFRPVPKPQPVRIWEVIRLDSERSISLDQDGFTRHDYSDRDRMIAGSQRLAQAIQQARAA